MQSKNVAIFLFKDVEVLDFAGPFEVFAVTSELNKPKPFNVYTIAETPGEILARNNLSVNPTCTFSDNLKPDILIIPGGMGTRPLMNQQSVIDWIKTCSQSAELVLSVCTGSLLLAKAGLLENLEATTHHRALELLREVAPQTRVVENKRVVDNGKIITSGGISAGIDMSLYVVSKLLGREVAKKTAEHMEYKWEESQI